VEVNEVPEVRAPSVDNVEDNEICGACKKFFQNEFNGEKWIRCVRCTKWYHQKCQSVQKYMPDFVCEDCLLSAFIV